MDEGFQALSEREKETLRLLLRGHDAKSIARDLGLSIHTVNERLRTARRKMGVSSSREAARLLAAGERDDPQFLANKQLGDAKATNGMREGGPSEKRRRVGSSYLWLAGGMLTMLLIVAAMLSLGFHGRQEPPTPVAATAPAPATSPGAVETADAGTDPARQWVALLDQKRWDESWNAAGTLFRSRTPMDRWASTVQSIRQPLGPVSARVPHSAKAATSLPGAPDGEYRILQFQTTFADKRDAIETVVLAREGADWKVSGYFIR